MKALKLELLKRASCRIAFLFALIFTYMGCTLCRKIKGDIKTIYSYFYNSVDEIGGNQFNIAKTAYISTDTCSGIEIDYYYYVDEKRDRCINLKFFTPIDSTDKFNNIFDLFKKKPVSIIEYNTFSILSPYNYCDVDSFYYSHNNVKYIEQNFSSIASQSAYQLSDLEIIKIYKVHGLVDKFSGNLEYNKIAFPLLDKGLFNHHIWQFQYRKIFSRISIDTSNLFRLKLATGKKNLECHMTYE